MESYIGKYFSVDYIRKQILHFTDEEIEEMDLQIEKEKQLGIIQDPTEMMGMDQEGEPQSNESSPSSNVDTDLDSAFSDAISASDYNKGNI